MSLNYGKQLNSLSLVIKLLLKQISLGYIRLIWQPIYTVKYGKTCWNQILCLQPLILTRSNSLFKEPQELDKVLKNSVNVKLGPQISPCHLQNLRAVNIDIRNHRVLKEGSQIVAINLGKTTFILVLRRKKMLDRWSERWCFNPKSNNITVA